jgi:hypothetical protein
MQHLLRSLLRTFVCWDGRRTSSHTLTLKRSKIIILGAAFLPGLPATALTQNFEIGPFAASIILYDTSPLSLQFRTELEKLSITNASGHVQGVIRASVQKQQLDDKIQDIAKHFLPYSLKAAQCDITVTELHSTRFDVANYTGFLKTTAAVQNQGAFCFLKSGDYQLSIRFVPRANGSSVQLNIVDVAISSPDSIAKFFGVDKVIADHVRTYAAGLQLTLPNLGDGVKAAFQGANLDSDENSILLAVRMDAQASSGAITQILNNSGAVHSIIFRYPLK